MDKAGRTEDRKTRKVAIKLAEKSSVLLAFLSWLVLILAGALIGMGINLNNLNSFWLVYSGAVSVVGGIVISLSSHGRMEQVGRLKEKK